MRRRLRMFLDWVGQYRPSRMVTPRQDDVDRQTEVLNLVKAQTERASMRALAADSSLQTANSLVQEMLREVMDGATVNRRPVK